MGEAFVINLRPCPRSGTRQTPKSDEVRGMWLSAPTPPPLDLDIGHPSLAGLGNALAGRQYAEARCDEEMKMASTGPMRNCLAAWRNTPLPGSVHLRRSPCDWTTKRAVFSVDYAFVFV